MFLVISCYHTQGLATISIIKFIIMEIGIAWVAHPRGGSSSTVFRSKWNLEMLVFEENGNPECPEENLTELWGEPTSYCTCICCRLRESNQSHVGGRGVLSPQHH